jgi:GntR family transcriptional repressor for pyruvate dehydrogenase complex
MEGRMHGNPSEWADRVGRSRPTHTIVAEAIRRQITLGRLQPGDSLPTERELSQQLGIGRTTLRKAIKTLVDEGRVGTRRGRGGGTVVLESTNGSRSDALPVLGRYESAIEHTYEVRLALEPVAASLAATRATQDQVRALYEVIKAPALTVTAYHSLDSALHTKVAEASGNPLLLDAIENARVGFFNWANALWLNADWQRVRIKWGDTGRAFETDHRQIVEAIADGDPKGAHSGMAEHLRNGRDQFRELLGEIFPAEV